MRNAEKIENFIRSVFEVYGLNAFCGGERPLVR